MPYVLCRMVIGPQPDVRISEQLDNEVKQANARLPEIVAVEEKYDALMENFVEMESTLLTLGERHLAFEDLELKDLLVPRNLISRRIGNMLSSARLYRDSLAQHAGRILGQSDPGVADLRSRLQPGAAASMPFRIGEALRNYAQHQELPIGGITFGGRGTTISRTRRLPLPTGLNPSSASRT